MCPQQQQAATAAESGFSCETVSPSMLPGEARLWGKKGGRVERSGPLWLDLVVRGGAQPCAKEDRSWEHPRGTGGRVPAGEEGWVLGVLIGPRGGSL